MGFSDINLQVSGPQQPASIYKTKVLKGQVPFATQVTEPNTKYVIKHNFVLDGDVTIPENCILEFDGGGIYNGNVTCNETIIEGDKVGNAVYIGTYTDRSYTELRTEVDELNMAVGAGGTVDERIEAAVAPKANSSDVYSKAETYSKSETYNKTELNNMITTPNQQYETYTATDQTTAATDVLPATGETDTVYRVGNWDGTQYDTTCYTEYAWNGSTYVKISTKEVGIDDEPIVGSNSLVKSGGVAINMGVLEIENTSGEAKTISLSIFAGKKVLLYTNVAGQSILDNWTSTDKLVSGIYYLIDFANISTPKLYSSPNTGGKLYYSTNPADIEKFVNSKKIYNIFQESERGDSMFFFRKNKTEIVLSENQNSGAVFFPNKSDNILTKNALSFNVNDVFYLENKLHQWNGTQFVEIADEDNINSIINPQFPTTTYGYLDANGAAQNIGQSSTGCYVYNGYIPVKKGDKITYHGGYSVSDSFNPIWGYDSNKQNAVPLGNPFIGEEQEYNVIINSDTIKYIRYFGKTIYNPLVTVCRVPNDNKNPYDIIVAADGSGDYTSLYDAIVNSVGSHKSIFVKAGLYEMPVQTNSTTLVNNRDLSIVGEAKERVIIYNNNGVYTSFNNDATPIRMSGKVSLRNLTIISRSTDYVGEGTPTAYCVHVDFSAADGDIMEIDNCRMYNDHYACIGVGLRAGFTLKISNCELYSHSAPAKEQELWNGAIICHDGSAAGNAQRIEIVNNIIECTGKYALSLRTAFNNPFSALFIGNAIFSNNENPINKNSLVTLDAKSCNNNIDVQTHYD